MKTTRPINTTDKEWFFNYVDGEPQAQAAILSSIIGREYQQNYNKLESVCKNAGLYPAEIRAIFEWMEGGTDNYINEINRLLTYFEFNSNELYREAVLEYYNNRIDNVSSHFVYKR